MSLSAIALGIGLLLANGLFVAAEFALLAARRARIEQLAEDGSFAARSALAGLQQLSMMLAGAQLGITMASLGLGAVAEPAVHAWLDGILAETAIPRPVSATASLVLALGLVIFLHLVVGEMAPKSWAISAPERAILLLAVPFRGFVWVLGPFIRLLNAASNAVVRSFGVEPQDELAMAHAPGDLALLLEESARQGTLPRDQETLLSRAIDLSGLDAEAAMVPRTDIWAVDAAADPETIEEVARRSGRSRLPVMDGGLDQPVGVVHVKDALTLTDDERSHRTAQSLARQTLYAPESRPLEDLLVDMRDQRRHLVFVVDEFGSVTGLVTLEDVLEELIGEFYDESDRRERIHRRADGVWLVPGTLRPDELAAQTGLQLPPGEWETVAGYLMASLGRLPQTGDGVEHEGTRLEAAVVDGHRVVQVAVSPPAD
ncbi:HlyC/CorC family transporter [Egibacter rhizosphaerae]|uniref:HlyC/CorC family transporter n=1 Tax=Egibacter rhizosphaerae TaxID=1670831 RepID=A0A411YJS0_9ACTN|nr:hemolysin family protein [Egibacter rhizosphaerae]QBI21445.1 HlyC/CorC family transporter [Egibacter rhizosphaerae]